MAEEEGKQPQAAENGPTIDSYHCLCMQLLLVSTVSLESLPQRASPPSLDGAIILPVDSHFGRPQISEIPQSGTAYLHGVCPPSQPIMIRREDGFEKRWLAKCVRCSGSVGYWLDWAQWKGGERIGRRDDVLFLIAGSWASTGEMRKTSMGG